MPLNVCFQAGPTSNCHTVPYELGNPMEKLCQGVKRGCSRYKIYVHVCVSITNHSTKREISEGEKDVTFPLSLLSASHAALINLVRLFRDGRKRAARRRSRRMEEEGEEGDKGEAGRYKWRGDLISIRRRIVAPLPPGDPRR